jgi:hypothetical protein
MWNIPEDLVEKANQIAADLDDIHFNSRSSNWLGDAYQIVAAALLAERERCAKIAENCHECEAGENCDECRAIAAAIRREK